MELTVKIILDRIKANLEVLGQINNKVFEAKDKLDEMNGMLIYNPRKPKVERKYKKPKAYSFIFIAIIHEDLFFLMDCNSISVPQYKKLNKKLTKNNLVNKERKFYKFLKEIVKY